MIAVGTPKTPDKPPSWFILTSATTITSFLSTSVGPGFGCSVQDVQLPLPDMLSKGMPHARNF